MYRIIGADGKEYGPITAGQLHQWIAEGRANSQTKILPEGATEWRSLSEFPEFMPAITATVPPSLPGAVTVQAPAAASAQVNGPAVGLMIGAVLGFAVWISSLLINLLGASLIASAQSSNPALANAMSGIGGIIYSGIGLVLSALILVGAVNMKKLQRYELAMTASIVSLLPCAGCCFVGLPIGIWSLVVLSKPEVKSSFH